MSAAVALAGTAVAVALRAVNKRLDSLDLTRIQEEVETGLERVRGKDSQHYNRQAESRIG